MRFGGFFGDWRKCGRRGTCEQNAFRGVGEIREIMLEDRKGSGNHLSESRSGEAPGDPRFLDIGG